MSANVVSLLRGKPKATEATVQLVSQLRELVLDSLRDRLNVMFDGADDLLFEFAERATNNNDRRLFFDTMRAVRLGRKDMLRQFCESMALGFGPPPSESAAGAARLGARTNRRDDGDEEFTLQKSEAVELKIAVSNMATKADGLYKQMLWEIGGRMKALIEERQAPLSIEALTPTTICDAFRGCAEALDVEFAVELVIFKLFDRLVISDLADLYSKVLQFFKQHGIRAQHAPLSPIGPGGRPVSASPRADATDAPLPPDAPTSVHEIFRPSFATSSLFSGHVPPAGSTGAPLNLAAAMMMSPQLDPETLSTLQRIGASLPSAAVYSNASLAADLAAAAQGQVIVGWGPRQTTAYVQRASLVGHMFNDILADPHLPTMLRSQFDGLRLSTIKVALRDFAFVSDPDHPVRGLINELATMATTARAGGADTLERIAELVGQIQNQFDIASETLRKPAADIELIDTEQAERFIEQQVAQTNARRQAMVKRVRRIIAEELQLRTRGYAIADEVRTLLHSAWAPMMAMHLLHHGPDSKPWREGMSLLDRILHSLDPRRVETRGETVLAMLFADIETEFKAVGLAEARIQSALAGYRAVLEKIDPAAPPEAAAVDPTPSAVSLSAVTPGSAEGVSELLELLITPGAWFLIHDHDRGESRWMKAVAFYAGLDCAAFAEFNGSNTLLLKSRMLLDDLVARRTVPIDLGPTAKSALDRFLARAA